jgi:glycosyltransferase involved in cell wall biosynthesis
MIDPHLGLDLVPARTLERTVFSVSVVIPAHNESATIGEVVGEAIRGLASLDLASVGEVVVSASACTDGTADVAEAAGARIVEAGIGKGAAVAAGVSASTGDVVCLIDGDVRYFGDPPLVPLLVEPILLGIADATISDLYWRPLYPQLWSHGFFSPLAGALFPELPAKVGSTPWSGQRAAIRELWPNDLPVDFTVDLALLLHWNRHAVRLRPVLADDWVNPQRPKPDLMAKEFELLLSHAIASGRISAHLSSALHVWFEKAYRMMAEYRPDVDNPQDFEMELLARSLEELRTQLNSPDAAADQ